MNQREQIRQFLAANPGSTTKQVSAGIGIDANRIAGQLHQMLNKSRCVRREQTGKTLSNVPIYSYWVVDNVSNQKGNVSKPEVQEAKAETRKPSAPKTSSLDAMIDELSASIAKQLALKVKSRLVRELESLAPTTTRESVDASAAIQRLMELPAPAAKEVTRLPKVGVLGLLPVQAGEISAEFGACMDLVFWDGGDHSTLRSMAKSCDVVFIHTRHAKHSWDQTLQTNGANIQRVTGGVSNLKDAMTKYFVEKEA